MGYIIIPFMEIQRANAQAATWLMSPLPVFAAVMLGHALADDLGTKSVGVAYLHHNAHMLAEKDIDGEYNVFPHQFRGASFINKDDYSSKNRHALSVQPSFSVNLLCSIVIEVEGPAPTAADVDLALAGRRLAGGLIISTRKVKCVDSKDDLYASIPQGFAVVDRSNLLIGNPIETLLGETHEPTPRLRDGNEVKPWRSATVLGYTAITDFEKRKGVRDDLLHAFAEPMVGLVDLISMRKRDEYPDQDIFWKHGWPHPEIFLLSQSPNSFNQPI